ncbi:tetraacyldisaccharide 4'-kinase [Candidatus Pelagibacter sp.]|nr:tetraacyldisaccharide 4'-kinase [Candidatus Pelagibacter sp.]
MKFKKPKFWDYKKPNLLSYLFLPFTFPIIINNFLLNSKKKNRDKQIIKKICVGNIYVGGTAKTPLTIKIYQILSKLNFKTATIKKFYKDQIDEQIILKRETKLYCLRNRKNSIKEAIKDKMDVVVFDDGLQDRSIDYDLKFVCFNNINWIGNGQLIPAGPLREKIESISKYDVVFINGNENDNSNLKLLIKKYNNNIQVFETRYKPINIDQFDINEEYIIFSGIGNPKSFKETLIKNKFKIIEEIIFPDHYKYTQNDINKIKLKAKNLKAKILTTEKDYVKLNSNINNDINFLKVDIYIKNEEILINYLKSNI